MVTLSRTIPKNILQIRSRLHVRYYSETTKSSSDHRASSKLFDDAAKEESAEQEAQLRASRIEALYAKDENWTGEESMQDAVLRMLVDKYKPLRSGSVRTADEKLKQSPPEVGSDVLINEEEKAVVYTANATSSHNTWSSSMKSGINMAKVPLLPAIEGHQPWHTTFRAPSHSTSSVKYGNIPPPSSSRSIPVSPLDEQARKKERDARKRSEQGLRLSRARESTLDYRLGLKGTAGHVRRPNPVSMKGWASLVEDRIEIKHSIQKARLEGQFKVIKGRGQPLKTLTEEKNPFIAREEFLMNRIVQRNGAAPPWVEIQGELESAVSAFRDTLKQSWTRRAIRMLTLSQAPASLPKLSISRVAALRDPEWETRERGYHDAAVEELNSLVRRYNGVAPYAVRRAYYMRTAELERVYENSAEDIIQGITDRISSSTRLRGGQGPFDEDDGKISGGNSEESGGQDSIRFMEILKEWFSSLRKRAR